MYNMEKNIINNGIISNDAYMCIKHLYLHLYMCTHIYKYKTMVWYVIVGLGNEVNIKVIE